VVTDAGLVEQTGGHERIVKFHGPGALARVVDASALPPSG
jgi:hypothetical protein